MSAAGFIPPLDTPSLTTSQTDNKSPVSQDTAQSNEASQVEPSTLSLTVQPRVSQSPVNPEGHESEAIDPGESGDVDSDNDERGQNGSPGKARGPTAKKRREDSVFQAWLEKNQREVTKSSKEDLERHDRLSAARLLEDSTSKKIIASPREYQIELFERAKERNTIVVLDTGSGKTLIAALLLRHILEQELQNRSEGQRHKISFFLVEKVALCFQQHAVLTCNLEFPIGKFYGEMTGVLRTKEYWDSQFAENMAVVCTAQILLDLLNCGFIQMNQINLLIFDEAHHTKKNHPYARIIKDHYLREVHNRPRILGMTASPVDAQTKDIRYAATELEGMLCSKIATVSDETLLQSQAHKQQIEIKEYYQRLENPKDSQTQLWETIASYVRENLQFRHHLDFAQVASSMLGTWCADRYWELLMTDSEMSKLEAKTERDFASDLDTSTGDEAVAAVRQVKQMIRDHDFKSIHKDSPQLSTKARILYEILEDAFCQRQAKRCIVFVQARSTAFLLADLFQQPGMHIPGMKASFMIGSNTGSSSAANMSYRDQIISLQKFRYGETNCLFATSVAEEGIDIPECDIIVRFDLYTSAIQYIQSKGRARQKTSLYISMLEEGNMEHLRRLRQATRDAHALKQFCTALPEDRKVQDFVIDAAAVAQLEQVTQKTYTIRETGAQLNFITSLEVLSKFASSLPANGESEQQLEYVVTSIGKKFIARIIFPDTSPVKTVCGEAQRSKQLARCSAAFEACMELIRKKYVDGHLQPVFAKKLPAMRNARLAIKSDKKSEYDMRVKPEYWVSCLSSTPPTELFPTLIALNRTDTLGSCPLILLTRHPLPHVPTIPLFFGNGQTSAARLSASRVPIKLPLERVEALATFTLRVFADVFSKEYDAKPEEIPYFIAPNDPSGAEEHGPQVDWTLLQYVQDNERLSWENAPVDFFKDKFAVDPWDGSRKFIINGINKDLKPSDPTPKGVPQPKSLAYRKVEQNIKEYSNSLSIKSRQRRNWRDDQPVVNAELLSLRRNFLDEYFIDDEAKGSCYIILEPLNISPLPVNVVSMALVLPVIMYRIDSVMISLEACSLVGLAIRPDLALEAVTKDSFNTEEHGEDQIDFQAGMGRNYERLEFLGDTFLKMATTISVFTLIPSGDEFEYHVERMVMLCNANLFTHAIERKMQEYIRTRAFDRRTWYPNMTLKKGKAIKTELRHRLSHKSVADVCEALIGAAYLTSADGDMNMAVKAVTAMVNADNHRMASFSDYYAAFKVPEWHKRPPTAVQRLAVDQVAEVTGYRFQSATLVRSAFRHPSYMFETIPDYQRLEFLGDALLDMAIVDYLFKRFPEADPKWLTEHKNAMVSNQFQGCLCVKLGLHKHILVATSALLGDIREYVSQLEQAEELARLKAQGGGTGISGTDGANNNNASATGSGVPPRGAGQQAVPKDFWIDAPQPPKALADVVEALVGAMFVDARYDYGVVQRFFTQFIQPYFEEMALYDSFASNHPVTALTHRLQDLGCTRWTLHVANVPAPVESGVAVLADSDVVCAFMVHERVLCHATAKNGSNAKVAVAKMALERFAETKTVGEFQTEMACNCGSLAAKADIQLVTPSVGQEGE